MDKTKKIKIAFIKSGGLSIGGTEKFLQIIAANLSKDKFEVDYYYSDKTQVLYSDLNYLDTDPERIKFMKEHGVNLIKFNIGSIDLSSYTHKWINTDFWQIFDEKKYDIIQTGKPGRMEYPFNKIKNTPIVDSIHLNAGADNQYNISRVMHITDYMAKQWVKKGGDKKRIVRVSLPIEIPNKEYGDYRDELNIKNKFIFGFHQRPDDKIFSSIPLNAYKKIEKENNYFIILGGSDRYRKQAEAMKIKNIYFLPPTGDKDIIFKFLNTLNVFAHGRKDGENNSQAIAEAMHFGKPIISHFSEINNGHIETIENAGIVVKTVDEYAEEMKKLQYNKEYYTMRSINAKKNFLNNYDLKNQIKKIENIYFDVIKNPFPNKIRRFFYSLHYTQTIRPILGTIYFFFKFKKYRIKL